MKPNKKQTGWLDKKLVNPKFRKVFSEEYLKLSIGEQLLRLRRARAAGAPAWIHRPACRPLDGSVSSPYSWKTDTASNPKFISIY